MLVWTYSKDGSGSAGQDAAWVDQLEIIPIPPSIITQPISQTVLKGSNVLFSVSASGTPPLSYQWYKNSLPLLGNPAGGPNPYVAPSFTMTNVTRTNSGGYSVVITNTAGAITSVTAVLTVHVPQKLTQPILQTNGTFVLLSGDNDGGKLFSSNLPAFHLAASSNLVDWVQVPSTITLSNGLLQIQDTNTSSFPTRFYRVFEDW
jgi:Immunoglobulin domain